MEGCKKGDEIAIQVRDVKKSFRLYNDKCHTIKEKALHKGRGQYHVSEVLKGVSFTVKQGEALGLIGHNGCGKSTLLKLLTRIMYPDEGSIALNGRVSSLLELGAGFHPDMSGRENIYINASIFGLGRKEIDQRIGSIIEFSELEEFIDNPVRTYSSGMYMRLAFSVAINVNADILLIDEILAVGDVNFQAKCFRRLMEIKGSGTTIVLVSHSTAQIERICDRSIWIQDGLVRREGSPADVHREYLDYMARQREDAGRSVLQGKQENMGGKSPAKQAGSVRKNIHNSERGRSMVEIASIVLKGADDKERTVFRLGETVRLELKLNALVRLEAYFIEINLVRADGLFCAGCSTAEDGAVCSAWTGRKRLELCFTKMELLAGNYHFDLHIAKADGGTFFFCGNIAAFEIEQREPGRGIMRLEHHWIWESKDRDYVPIGTNER